MFINKWSRGFFKLKNSAQHFDYSYNVLKSEWLILPVVIKKKIGKNRSCPSYFDFDSWLRQF